MPGNKNSGRKRQQRWAFLLFRIGGLANVLHCMAQWMVQETEQTETNKQLVDALNDMSSAVYKLEERWRDYKSL